MLLTYWLCTDTQYRQQKVIAKSNCLKKYTFANSKALFVKQFYIKQLDEICINTGSAAAAAVAVVIF